ncbi:ATP-binding response regulator [Verrucomicrobiota bacterium sgz303538]
MDKPERTNILLVDDKPERLLVLRTILEPLNQNLVPASSGQQALRELLRRDFSVILLDVHMPNMDGFETAQMIRDRPRSAHTPIVFVTGSQEWADMERAYELGAVDFIPVPMNPLVLRTKVSVFVDLFQTAAQARLEAEARAREEEARKRAEAESSAKDDFLATVSHELRTPLTPILAIIQTLEHDLNPDSLRQALHVIRRNLELEARLIDDLLDLTRIRTGKLHMHCETINIQNALNRAVEICAQKAKEKQMQLTYEPTATEDYTEGDSARLQQVFWNLIHNAIKFTPAGGKVTVRTENPAPHEIRIDVIDNGIGIAPSDLGRIFNRFMQFARGKAPEGGTGGLGLGLAISKSLVEAHGGQIWASSLGRGHGTTLSVTLKTTAARPASSTPLAEPSTVSGEPLRILLVDDHKDTRDAMQKLLIRKGYYVQVAEDVRSGLALAQSHEFDLLISDIGLPDGTGNDLMKKIREFHSLPGIALSGFGMQHDIERSKQAGFIEHLTKPVNFSQLQAVITKLREERAS